MPGKRAGKENIHIHESKPSSEGLYVAGFADSARLWAWEISPSVSALPSAAFGPGLEAGNSQVARKSPMHHASVRFQQGSVCSVEADR